MCASVEFWVMSFLPFSLKIITSTSFSNILTNSVFSDSSSFLCQYDNIGMRALSMKSSLLVSRQLSEPLDFSPDFCILWIVLQSYLKSRNYCICTRKKEAYTSDVTLCFSQNNTKEMVHLDIVHETHI